MANANNVIQFPYTPRKQFSALHHRGNRWACMVAHRRAGKTVACINELVIRALYSNKHNSRYAYIAPYYKQAKEVAWVYLKEATKDIAVRVREADLRIELPNHAWVTLYGSDNPDALRGLYFDGVVLDEYGDCRPSLWVEVVLPTLLDRKGWAIFIGTPKGKNHFYEIYRRSLENPDWFHLTLKASQSGILTPEDLNEMRTLSTPEAYAQEMECDFTAAVRGTYYADVIQQLETSGQIAQGACSYDPTLPVQVAADLGYTDSTAMWFWQNRPDGIAIIDYLEAQGKNLSFYFDQLDSKPYTYETIWLPHDARAKTLQTGRSTIEQFLEKGYPCRITPSLKVQQGIDAARLILPKCWIDTSTASEGVEALRAYRRTYNEMTKTFSEKPLHDWASDGADAFRYLALVASVDIKRKPPKSKVDPNDHTSYTLEQLYAERDADKPPALARMRM